MWTYFILAVVLVLGTVIANFALTSPETAKEGTDAFLGLPPYAFPAIAIVVGVLVFLLGLKLETDWPEGIGAPVVDLGIVVEFEGEVVLETVRFDPDRVGPIEFCIATGACGPRSSGCPSTRARARTVLLSAMPRNRRWTAKDR